MNRPRRDTKILHIWEEDHNKNWIIYKSFQYPGKYCSSYQVPKLKRLVGALQANEVPGRKESECTKFGVYLACGLIHLVHTFK